MKYIKPFQEIEHKWKLSNDTFNHPNPLNWESWTLKLQKHGCDELQITMKTPEELIDPTQETGLQMTIGDEIGLYAFGGGYTLNDIKRFGGYLGRIEMNYGKESDMTLTALDYSYALKNIQVFKDYYKILPIPLGLYTQNVPKYQTRNTLYEAIQDLTALAGFTDYEFLENPYLFKLTGNTCPTRTSGSVATCSVDNSLGNPGPSLKFKTNAGGDSIAKWNLYYNATGYELIDYPYLIFNYYAPVMPVDKYYYYFELTVNGETIYVPWWGVPSNEGYVTPRAYGQYSTSFIPLTIDLYDGVVNQFDLGTNLVNTVTQIDLCAEKPGTTLPPSTNFWMDNIGVVDMNQVLNPKSEYVYKDALTILKELARQCNHEFRINPYKQPIVYDDKRRLSDFSIIEGDNLLTASIGYSDDSFYNNIVVMGNLENDAVIMGHAINPTSIEDHLQYMLVEENSEMKDTKSIMDYAKERVKESSTLIPTIKCVILPNYEILPGMIIPVFIPSLGIQKSLEILTITHDYKFTCEVELGSPPSDMVNYLKQVAKYQKIGLTRQVARAQDLTDGQTAGKFNKPFVKPKGKIILTGMEMLSPHVNIAEDRDENDDLIWTNIDEDVHEIIFNNVTHESNNYLLFGLPKDVDAYMKFPFGIDTRNIRNAGLLYLDFKIWSAYTSGSNAEYMDIEIYQDYDPINTGTPIWSDSIRLVGNNTSTAKNLFKKNIANGCENGTIDGFIKTGTWSETTSMLIPEYGSGYQGNYCLRHTTGNGPLEQVKTEAVVASAGTRYTASVYAKKVGPDIQFNFEFLDSGGNVLNTTTNSKTLTTSYARYYISEVAPTNTVSVRCVFIPQSLGTIWYDAFQLETTVSTPTTWEEPGCPATGSYSTYVVLNDATTIPPLDYYHIVCKFRVPSGLTYPNSCITNYIRLKEIVAIYGANNDITTTEVT